MERLRIKDVPSEMLQQIRNQFESDVQIRQLRIKQNLLQRTGYFAKAMELGKTIENLYEKVIDNYIEETIKESDSFSLEEAGIPVNDIKKVNEYALTMFMACDIIQSCIIDINDLLHKTDKDLYYEQFDDIKQISEIVKSKLDFLQKNSTYMNNVFWGDKCDDMYSMMLNKAKAIIRKRNNDKSWNVEFDKMKGE